MDRVFQRQDEWCRLSMLCCAGIFFYFRKKISGIFFPEKDRVFQRQDEWCRLSMLCCAGFFFFCEQSGHLPPHIHTHIHTYSCEHMSYCFGSHDNMIYVPNITYIHTYIHTCIHAYIHTHTHTYILVHTYTHTHIHTHIHTYRHGVILIRSQHQGIRREDLAHQALPSRLRNAGRYREIPVKEKIWRIKPYPLDQRL